MHNPAERLRRKTLNASHTETPRMFNVDKNLRIRLLLMSLKLTNNYSKRQNYATVKYLNNRVELSASIPLRD